MGGNSKKLLAFNYFGGKFYWLNELYSHFPEHKHFVDLFCGSMSVILNKPQSSIDTANDINSNVTNFFRVLRSRPDELIEQLKLTPVGREEYNNCWQITDNDLENARRFYVRARQSFFGLGQQRRNKGWHLVKKNSRSNLSETISKWRGGIEQLTLVADKITKIQIENKDFRELIPILDYEDAFFYCDPPYPKECRGSYNDYAFEFTDHDHEELADLLHGIAGKAMVSGYECELLNNLYKDWSMIRLSKKANAIRSKIVQECIWINYDPEEFNEPRLNFAENNIKETK